MSRVRVKRLLTYMLCCLIVGQLGCSSEKKHKILIFSKSQQREVGTDEAVTALASAARENGIAVDTTTNVAYFTRDSLENYGAVVFLQTSADILDTRRQNEFERFLQAGGGFVGIHAASHSEYQWPWFNDMIGAGLSKKGNGPTDLYNIFLQTSQKTFTKDLPESWSQQDELYGVDTFSSEINIVAQTKDGMPVSWYREYDGGYMFYTAAGGNAKSFKKKDFLGHIITGINYTLKQRALDYENAYTKRLPADNRFLPVVLDSYLDEPIEMEILPDGGVLFIERNGKLKLYDPEKRETKVVAGIDVHTTGNYEDGLLGLAIDPRFDFNNYIYLYYSPVGDKAVQYLSRFKLLGGDSLIRASEKVVLEVPVQRETCCHSAGNIYFGPDGYLYLTTGDNTSSKESDGFSPMDERPGRAPFDAQKSSGNTHDLRGKILRIQVEQDGSYTIPDGNLFPKNGTKGRPEIYVMGARNPYRMTVDKRGYVYWGDVGPDGGTSSERGPKSYDEWNQARKPGNYGWPYFVGDNKAYADFNFATGEIGSKLNPDKPVNESPNNFGSRILPPAQEAMIWYPYDRSEEFPMLGTGSRSAMSGPFFYKNDYKESPYGFPDYYDEKLFIFEWARSWIKVLTFNKHGDLEKIEPFLPHYDFSHPIDIKFGPDGVMYVLTYGANYFAQNPDAHLIRIDYAEGNRKPVARISTDTDIGAAPLTIQLSAKASFDYDKDDKLTYRWESGAEEEAIGETTSFTYSKPGIYTPVLTVIDDNGEKATAGVEIKVGNDIPVVDIDLTGNKTFYFDNDTLEYSVQVSDKEDGSLHKGVEPRQVVFSVDYLPEGKDLALLSSNAKYSEKISTRFIKGITLMEGSDCASCHALDKKSVGPSWQAIATRYKNDERALPMLAEKIISGGNGNWGKTMMAAHPQHSTEETMEMAKYILSLGEEATGKLPLQGGYSLKDHIGKAETGTYILSASYTDNGNRFTGRLTGRKSIFLRNPKVQGEDFDNYKNIVQRIPHGKGAGLVTDIKHGSYISFNQIDLQGIGGLVFNIASGEKGNMVEVRLNTPKGKLIGLVKTDPDTDDPWQFRKYILALGEVTGVNDIYFVFRNDRVKERNLMNLDWIHFQKAGSKLHAGEI